MLFEKLEFPSRRQVKEVLRTLKEVEDVMVLSDFVDRVPERAVARRDLMDKLARTRVAFENLLTAMVASDG